MEKYGILEKCEPPWNSPLVRIKKKRKDEICVCLVTDKPIFPIPSTEEMMDVLNGSVYFTTLENAFYQVELNESSKIKSLSQRKTSSTVLIVCHSELQRLRQLFQSK